MKKMWKLNNKAVSPVIATILMVAITVVLAAVLYVMVMGFGGEGGQTPSGSFTVATNEGSNIEKLQFASFEPNTAITELKFSVIGGTVEETVIFTTSADTPDVGTLGVMTFHDLGDDGYISAGDYITIDMTGSAVGTINYVVTIIYSDNGDMIDDIEFSWTVAAP